VRYSQQYAAERAKKDVDAARREKFFAYLERAKDLMRTFDA